MNSLTKNSDVDAFVALVMKGVEAWIEAGKILVKNIDEDPDFGDKICDKCPDISAEMVCRFEQIGRQELHPRLLLSDAPGIRRLRKLPYDLQEKYVTHPVNMLATDGSTINADVRNLTPDQAAQVFKHDGIRSLAEQRLWIEDTKAKQIAPPTKANLPYRIVGQKLVVVQPCQFNRKELANLLAEIE